MPRISVFITSLLFPSCRVLSAEVALSRLKDFSLSLYTNVAHEGVSLSSSSPAPSERHLVPALRVLHEKAAFPCRATDGNRMESTSSTRWLSRRVRSLLVRRSSDSLDRLNSQSTKQREDGCCREERCVIVASTNGQKDQIGRASCRERRWPQGDMV